MPASARCWPWRRDADLDAYTQLVILAPVCGLGGRRFSSTVYDHRLPILCTSHTLILQHVPRAHSGLSHKGSGAASSAPAISRHAEVSDRRPAPTKAARRAALRVVVVQRMLGRPCRCWPQRRLQGSLTRCFVKRKSCRVTPALALVVDPVIQARSYCMSQG